MEASYPISASSQAQLVGSNPSAKKTKFEFNLEGLRGFVAVVVLMHHSLIHGFILDPGYAVTNKWITTLPGHSGVLLFFILSGYVIGLTSKNLVNLSDIKSYLYKRFIRLYPIYVASLCLTFALIINHYQYKTIIGHLFFLQNSVVSFISENNPLWSLNNEILYYLLFIPLCLLKLKPSQVCLASFIAGFIFYIILRQPLLCSYSIGFAFWTSGLWLAQSDFFIKQQASRLELGALLLVFLGFEMVNPFTTVILVLFEKLHIPLLYHNGPAVLIEDIGRFAFLFYIFLRFTNRIVKGASIFIYLTIISGLAYYCYTIVKYQGITSTQAAQLSIPVLFLFIGLLILSATRNRPVSQHMSQLPSIFLKLGAISYSIYVLHYPTSIALSRISFFSGTALTFCVRLIIDLIVVISVSYVLELKFQPWVKKKSDLLFK